MGKAMRLIVPAAAVVLLAGCAASGPSRDEVADRFALELASSIGEPDDWRELSEGLADDALAGQCGSDTYRVGLGTEEALLYAWDATCSMYFESDMSQAQIERGRAVIQQHVLEGAGD